MKTLIILHGWQSSQERWRNVKNAIEKDGIEVIVPDLPGFKEGTALSRVWNLDDYVGWFKNFSSNRGNFFLLGHSFGGRMAIKFVAQYPERISGLILCSAAGIRPKRIRWYFLIMIGVKIGKRFSFLPFYSSLRKFFYRFVIRKQDYLKVSGIMKETFIKIIDEDLSSLLSKISVPTLLIWGKKDKITPLNDAYLMQKEIPNSNLKIISNVGHRINIETPEKLAEIATQFIKP